METSLIPYLNFDGTTTSDAMKFYQSIFGGELTMQTFAEAGMSKSDEDKNYIVHAELKTEGLTFMASSGQPGVPINFGDSVSMNIVGTDSQKLNSWFEKLSEGGNVIMPLEKQFWGDVFGMLKDKFGIQWMINIYSEKDGQQK